LNLQDFKLKYIWKAVAMHEDQRLSQPVVEGKSPKQGLKLFFSIKKEVGDKDFFLLEYRLIRGQDSLK